MNKKFLFPTLIVLISLIISSCGAFARDPDADVPEVGGSEATPALPTGSTVDISLAVGQTYKMTAGSIVVGDIGVSDIEAGPFVAFFDSDPATGLIVVFESEGYVNSQYEGAKTSTKSLSDIDAEMRASGCGGSCTDVLVKHYPADFAAMKTAWEVANATPTPQPTFTPEPVTDWTTAKIGALPEPMTLSNVTLLRATVYTDPRPADDCTAEILAGEVNNTSCSTKSGASYEFDVHLNYLQGINVNGDASLITNADGSDLYTLPADATGHILSSVICLKAAGCDLHISLPWAGFIGWFQRSNWTIEAAENVFWNQMRLIVVPNKLDEQIPVGQSTPVPNCGSADNGCQKIWGTQLAMTDMGNYITTSGVYDEQTAPYWFPK